MVSDHIIRMEKFDDSYRSVYENALKQTSLTAFLGRCTLTVRVSSQTNCSAIGSVDTVCSDSWEMHATLREPTDKLIDHDVHACNG